MNYSRHKNIEEIVLARYKDEDDNYIAKLFSNIAFVLNCNPSYEEKINKEIQGDSGTPTLDGVIAQAHYTVPISDYNVYLKKVEAYVAEMRRELGLKHNR